MKSIQEKIAFSTNGFIVLIAGILMIGIVLLNIVPFFRSEALVVLIPVLLIVGVLFSGLTIVKPNDAKVLTFFGKYVGTVKENGFLFTWPLTLKYTVPLKLINFSTDHLKVNDLHGNPIEIAAVVVWRVTDAARASFNVEDYREFVANQSDIAIRTLAAHYPYDSEHETSLRGNLDDIAMKLSDVLQSKLAVAGIVVEEARLSHLAYSSEIAAAMLKRQQAVAILQARQYMVENALAIIDGVIKHFEEKPGVEISDDKKAELINSLLIVMTSEKETNPVLSLG